MGESKKGIVNGRAITKKGLEDAKLLACGIHRQEQRKQAFQGWRTGQRDASAQGTASDLT